MIIINYLLADFIMVNLLLLVLLVTYACSESMLKGCFYTQKLKIINTTAFSPVSGGFSYQVTWDQSLTNITSHSYSLIGFRLERGTRRAPFGANITSTTSSGATFVFLPQSGSTISYIYFSIIIIQSCSGYIELQLIEFVSPEFSRSSRVNDISSNVVTLKKSFTNDVANYQISAFVSAFYLTSVSDALELRIDTTPIYLGSSTHEIVFTSAASHRNIYRKIWYTYLVIDLYSFSEGVGSYRDNQLVASLTAPSNTVPFNFGIPSNFTPEVGYKCIVSLTYLYAIRSSSPYEVSFSDLGDNNNTNITSIANMNAIGLAYEIFCLQKCTNGYIDVTISTYVCQRCQDNIAFCQVCFRNSTVICKKCQPGYFLLTSDNTCYIVCPDGYYNNNVTSICSLCNSVCQTCADNLNCISCKIGWPVEGGCTLIDGCTRALSPVMCGQCSDIGNYTMIGYTCGCDPGFYLITHLCINVAGCVAASPSASGPAICVLCNSMMGFVLTNGTCNCADGFVFNVTKCLQICGDGRQMSDQCDDGNTNSGDGCSSICKIQKDYQCTGGSNTTASKCIYTKFDVALSVARIEKVDFANQGIFTFDIVPKVGGIAMINLATSLSFHCNQSISISQLSYSNNRIVVTVDFLEDLQANQARVTLKLDSTYFLQSSTSLVFSMISVGKKLIIEDVGMLALCKLVLNGLSLLLIIVFLVSMFVHKMIGVQLLYPIQAIYLVHLTNSSYTTLYSLLKFISLASWNIKSLFETSTIVYQMKQNVTFSSTSQQFTLKVMIGTTILLFLALLLLQGLKMMKEQDKKSKQYRQIQKASIYLYNNFLFPMTISFFIIFFTISNTMSLHEICRLQSMAKYLFALFMVMASLIFFSQWKVFLFLQSCNKYLGQPRCHKNCIAVYITCIFVTSLLISYSYQHQSIDISPFVLVLNIALLLWIAVRSPYEDGFHNIGTIINLLPLIIFLAFNSARKFFPIIQDQKIEILIIYSILGIISLSILTTITRIIFQVRVRRRLRILGEKMKVQKKMKKMQRKKQIFEQISGLRVQCEGQNNNLKDNDIIYLNKFRKQNENKIFNKLKNESLSALQVVQGQFLENHYGRELNKKMKNKFLTSNLKEGGNKLDTLL